MMTFPRRFGALTLMLAAGLTTAAAQAVDPATITTTPTMIPSGTLAQDPPKVSDPNAQATTTDQNVAADMVRTDSKGRHFAPRGTFYLLSYVAVKTDKGVEGFDPGQEVRFVEAHQDTHTLVVTDGRAQVEVPPSKLTNDMDIAAMVRRNDQAGQAQVATYVQAEADAYAKAQRDAADATTKDLEHRKAEQAAEEAKLVQAQAQATPSNAVPTGEASYNNYGVGGYYDNGGYGYGTPYSYFVNRPINAGPSNNSSTGSGTVAPSQAGQSKVAAPTAGATSGRATAGPAGRPK